MIVQPYRPRCQIPLLITPPRIVHSFRSCFPSKIFPLGLDGGSSLLGKVSVELVSSPCELEVLFVFPGAWSWFRGFGKQFRLLGSESYGFLPSPIHRNTPAHLKRKDMARRIGTVWFVVSCRTNEILAVDQNQPESSQLFFIPGLVSFLPNERTKSWRSVRPNTTYRVPVPLRKHPKIWASGGF